MPLKETYRYYEKWLSSSTFDPVCQIKPPYIRFYLEQPKQQLFLHRMKGTFRFAPRWDNALLSYRLGKHGTYRRNWGKILFLGMDATIGSWASLSVITFLMRKVCNRIRSSDSFSLLFNWRLRYYRDISQSSGLFQTIPQRTINGTNRAG